MGMQLRSIGFCAALMLVACGPSDDTSAGQTEAVAIDAAADLAGADISAPNVMGTIPAGVYELDPSHSSLVFEVSHLGFSSFVGTFDTFDATLSVDPDQPSAAELTANVQLFSLDIPTPPAGFVEDLLGPDWLNAGANPVLTFKSTQVTPSGAYAALVTGDLSLNGVTAPVSMDVVFNGGWEGIPPDPHARVGFSATGSFNRSEFGVSTGIPEPGSTMGVGDAVTFRIETEFVGPEWVQPSEAAAE